MVHTGLIYTQNTKPTPPLQGCVSSLRKRKR
ncbi:hypothetical protein FKM82_030967 [Ascaphus truei]